MSASPAFAPHRSPAASVDDALLAARFRELVARPEQTPERARQSFARACLRDGMADVAIISALCRITGVREQRARLILKVTRTVGGAAAGGW